MASPKYTGASSIPTQALKSVPVTILYKLSNPFSSPLSVPKGGTGIGTFQKGDIVYGSGGVLERLPIGLDGQVLMTDSSKPYWSNDLIDMSNTLTTINSQQKYITSTLDQLILDSEKYITRLSNVSDSITIAASKVNALITQSSNQDQQILASRTQLQILQTSLVGVSDLTTSVQAEDAKATLLELQLTDINDQLTEVHSEILHAQDDINNLSSNINSFGMYKNKIVNGNFKVWQRAESYIGKVPLANVSYLTADRWGIVANSTVTVAIQKITGVIGLGVSVSKIVDAMHISFSGAGAKTLRYNIENARTLQGQQCTISFWAKGPAFTLTLVLKQMFGASSNTVFTTTFNITENYQQFVYTFNMPIPPSNTVLGPGHCVQLNFTSTMNWSLDLANVQLEQGPLSTFEYRPVSMELALCQRYYELGYAYMLGYVYMNTTPYVNCIFKTDKRDQPTIETTIVNSNSFTNTIVLGQLSTQQVSLGCTKNTYSTDGNFNVLWTANSEIYL